MEDKTKKIALELLEDFNKDAHVVNEPNRPRGSGYYDQINNWTIFSPFYL